MDCVNVSWLPSGVATLEIKNHPVNALNIETVTQLNVALESILSKEGLRVAILTGSGKYFSGGADLKEATRGSELRNYSRLQDTLTLIRLARKPIIAAINGPCIGGALELALSCDLRVASDSATFVCAGVNVGLVSSAHTLPRLIGESRAKAMLLTGLVTDAQTAEKWGLVTAVYPFSHLREETLRLAERISSRAPLSIEANKRIVAASYGVSSDVADRLWAVELSKLLESADYLEALKAFSERRIPAFKGE